MNGLSILRGFGGRRALCGTQENSFEEVIHRCEDERTNTKSSLKACRARSAILVTTCDATNEMPPEERSALRLRPETRVDRPLDLRAHAQEGVRQGRGLEIYQALQDAPAVAVPVVPCSLKSRRMRMAARQREWSPHVAAGGRAQLLQVPRPHGYQL